MRKFVHRYIHDLTRTDKGEGFGTILRYFIPEFITTFLLYTMPFMLDALFVASFSSATYTTLGITNNFINVLIKIAEAFSVGTIVLSGQFNGRNSFEDAGRTIRDAFWITCILGVFFGSALFIGAPFIYSWYGVADDVAALGVPFLRLRAVGISFMFIYLAFVGFLRGIKNTHTPMKIFIAGAMIFIFFDYVLIFGKYGFPRLGLQGSALATLIQYGVMTFIALGYVLFNKKNRKYGIVLLSAFNDISYIRHLLSLCWPVALDKSAMALAYVWLGKMLATTGACGLSAFCLVKDLERFAFIPALAFAQIITFLVSNDFGAKNWDSIRINIKKVVLLASVMVATILVLITFNKELIVTLFDKKGDFTTIALRAFPLLGVFVLFDLLQLLLSGALRGAGDARTVLTVRIFTCFFYFVPFSYLISRMVFQDEFTKFIIIYSSFYLGNALMSIWYIRRLRGESWKTTILK